LTLFPSSPTVFRRWLDAFVGLPDRIKLPVAVFMALAMHALILFLVWAWPLIVQLLTRYSLLPAGCTATYVAPKPTPEPKRLEVVLYTPTPAPKIPARPTPTPAPLMPQEEQLLKELFAQLPPERQREYIDVEGLARKKNTSAHALLESWRDSVAGSRKRGDGTDPLPSLDGLENMEFVQLTDRELSLGKPVDPEEAESSSKPSPPSQPKPADSKTQAPDVKPDPATPAPTPTPRAATPVPKSAAAAKATPPPNVPAVEQANADQIPIFLSRPNDPAVPKNLAAQRPDPDEPKPDEPKPQPTATPLPKPTPVPTARPTPSPMPTPAPRATPAKPTPEPQSVIVAAKFEPQNSRPKPIANPGYAPQMRRTKVSGSNLPPGEDGVDSVATPLGRYKKAVSSAVGSRWNYYIQQRMSLLQTGKVTAIFTIDANGKLRGFRLDENTSNSAHAALVEQCIREAEFDPPPPEALRNGVFEYPMSFHLL